MLVTFILMFIVNETRVGFTAKNDESSTFWFFVNKKRSGGSVLTFKIKIKKMNKKSRDDRI